MAKTGWIKAEVSPGTFRTERSVRIEIEGRTYNLTVDEDDVRDDSWVRVYVVEQGPGRMLVDLPRDTFTSGSRIFVPDTMVQLEHAA